MAAEDSQLAGGVTRAAPGRLDRRSLAASVSLLYGAVYLHYGVLGLFMPVWLAHAGLKASEIGLLVSAPMLLRIAFVAPVSALADHLRRIRELLFVCLAGTAVLIAALGVVHGFVALVFFFVALSVVWDPVPILADAYGVAAVRARQLDYGRMRVWGSLGFVIANLAGGRIIDFAGIGVMPMLTAALLVVPLLVIPFLPPDRRLGTPEPSPKGEWRTLLKDRSLVIVILATALIVASSGLFVTFSAIRWTEKHFSSTYIGFLSAVGIASEVVVLWGAQKALGARSPLWLILIAGSVVLARWLLMSLDPDAAISVAAQLLNGGGMGVIAGLMLFIAQRTPVRLMATAQGINAVIAGVATAVSAAVSGYVWQALGPGGYLLMALIAASGMAIIAVELKGTKGAAGSPATEAVNG